MKKVFLLPIMVLGKNNKHIVIHDEEILHMDGTRQFTTLHLINKEQHVVTKILKEILKSVDNKIIYRIHKAHAVNLKHIKEIDGGRSGFVTLCNGDKIPISYRRKLDLKKRLRRK